MALKDSQDRQDGYLGLEATMKMSCGGNWHEDHVSVPHKRISQVGADWSDSESPVRLARGMSACKLSRNLSSLSRSPTIMSSIDSLPCMDEAITVKDNKVNCADLDCPVKARGLSSSLSSCKLTRNPSSLCRSPTVNSGVDSLSSMPEVLTIKGNTVHMDRVWQQELAKRQGLHVCRMNSRVLLPFVVMLGFPCVYYYAIIVRNARLGLPLDAHVDGSVWFGYVALLFFFSAIVISIKIAFPRVSIMYGLRGVINRSWASLSLTCLRPVGAFLAEDREKKKLRRSSSVIWTIGSKPKTERMKNVKEGVQVYSNGDVFEGEFHQGCCSGSGVYYFYMSGRYEGDWVDGKYDGYGVETWARGSRYRGQYRQGLREGYGMYKFYTGDVYAGEWSKGQSHGCGVQTCEDGSRYVGEFKWGVKHGFGHYCFRNRDTYTGEYFADMMHGYGVYQFVNGHQYEGAWHEGKRHGLGLYTFRNGETQAGYWHTGMLQTSSTLNPPPGTSVAVSHTKVLHAVQEARRAAAKAFEVPHVDERVNKAVASANQAANAARVAAAKSCAKGNA